MTDQNKTELQATSFICGIASIGIASFVLLMLAQSHWAFWRLKDLESDVVFVDFLISLAVILATVSAVMGIRLVLASDPTIKFSWAGFFTLLGFVAIVVLAYLPR